MIAPQQPGQGREKCGFEYKSIQQKQFDSVSLHKGAKSGDGFTHD